jgi:hypothetical protein
MFLDNRNSGTVQEEGYVLWIEAGLMIVKDSIFRNNEGTLFRLNPAKAKLRFEGKNLVEGIIQEMGTSDIRSGAMESGGLKGIQISEGCTFYVPPSSTNCFTVIATTVSITVSLDPAESGTNTPIGLITGLVASVVFLAIVISIGIFLWKRAERLKRESEERREEIEPSFLPSPSEAHPRNRLSTESDELRA